MFLGSRSSSLDASDNLINYLRVFLITWIHVDNLFNWHVVGWRKIPPNRIWGKLCPWRSISSIKPLAFEFDQAVLKSAKNQGGTSWVYHKKYYLYHIEGSSIPWGAMATLPSLFFNIHHALLNFPTGPATSVDMVFRRGHVELY